MEERHSGYRGKWLKWALIYLVAGAIVYFIVYLVFFKHGGGRYVMVPLLLAGATRRIHRPQHRRLTDA
jgi:hypothetical protein